MGWGRGKERGDVTRVGSEVGRRETEKKEEKPVTKRKGLNKGIWHLSSPFIIIFLFYLIDFVLFYPISSIGVFLYLRYHNHHLLYYLFIIQFHLSMHVFIGVPIRVTYTFSLAFR